MDVEFIFLVGRVLFGGYFLLNGIMHFTHIGAMATYAAAHGVQKARPLIYLAGVLVVAGGVTVLWGARFPVAAVLLTALLIVLTVILHAFWRISEPRVRQRARKQMFSNAALVGALLLTILQQ